MRYLSLYSSIYSPLDISFYSPLLCFIIFTVIYISLTLPGKCLLLPVPLKKGATHRTGTPEIPLPLPNTLGLAEISKS